MTLWRPDEVTSALEDYIEELDPRAEYAPWDDSAWRRCQVPLHLQAEPAASAPLAFSTRDDPVTIESVDTEAIRYRAQVTISWLYPVHPAAADTNWRGALLAGHSLLAHLLRPTPTWPRGLTPAENRGTTIRRSMSLPGWMLCDLTIPILYDSSLHWS